MSTRNRKIIVSEDTLAMCREILSRGVPANMERAQAYSYRCGELQAALRWLVEAADAQTKAKKAP